jgi:hypothetical protein
VAADRVHERAQQRSRLTDPVGERRAGELHALARVDLGLTVQRQVVGVLGDQDVREQARTRAAALDRQGRHGRLRDRPAGPAAELRADVAVHDEASGDVLDELARVLAEGTKGLAAVRAVRLWSMDYGLARQMVREGLALGVASGAGGRALLAGCVLAVRHVSGSASLGRADALPLEDGQLAAQLLDQEPLLADGRVVLRDHGLERADVVRQRRRREGRDGRCRTGRL